MTSYNEVNEEYANENKKLSRLDILRKEWGFDGLVVTDWGGSNDHVKGVMCQSDLEMPAPGLSSARGVSYSRKRRLSFHGSFRSLCRSGLRCGTKS